MRPYNYEMQQVTWETCSLRRWLNDDFYNAAFASDEKEKIVEMTIITNNNRIYGTNGGGVTTDKVFLLSIEEIEEFCGYSAYDEAATGYLNLSVKATTNAVINGALVVTSDIANSFAEISDSEIGNCWRWLRTPGDSLNTASSVTSNANISLIGHSVEKIGGCVRPAIWIYLND